MELAELVLAAGDHNLLMAPPAAVVPERALVCTAVGEPGKEGVQFAARFIRHLGAQATILTVLKAGAGELETEHAQRFLAAGVRTLSLLGVPARSAVRVGDPLEEIQHEADEERSDLLVVGPPRRGAGGKSCWRASWRTS